MKIKIILNLLIALFIITVLHSNSNAQNNGQGTSGQEQIMNNSLSGLTITAKTIKKDPEGNIISNADFDKLLASGEYLATPVIKDGKIVEAQLQKASKEQVAALMKMFENSSDEEIGRKAPDFEVRDLNGTRYKLSDLKDKTVVLNFWFTACKPCVLEMPELNELVQENKDVIFLGLSTDKKERIMPFLKKTPFKYNIIADALDIATLYQVNSFPTHYIIKNGVIKSKFVGLSSDIKDKLQNAINGTNQDSSKSKAEFTGEPVMLSPDSDIRNEKGEKLDMMQAVSMINSQKYTMENAVDKKGKKYILIKKMK